MRLDCTGPRPRLDITDPALRLTDAQQQALAIDRELVVSAGAGAGKTTVLSLRYVALLLELAALAVARSPLKPQPEIGAVLVLTFTEKAAEEMAERCYRRLLALADLVREDEGARASLARYDGEIGGHVAEDGAYARALSAALDHLVDRFEAARIGTFHSFCAQVLHAFPAETGTPPEFDVLDELDSRELRGSIAESVLGRAYAEDADRMGRLVASVGSHRGVRDALLHVIDNRSLLRPILRRHAAGQVTVRDLLDLFPESPQQLMHWLEMAALPVLEEILTAVALSPTGPAIPDIRRLAARIEDLMEEGDPDAFDIIGVYQATLQALCTRDGRKTRTLSHHTVVGRKSDWRVAGLIHYDTAKEILDRVAEQLVEWPERLERSQGLPTRADAVMLGALQVLADLAIQADQALEEHFQAEAVLDFDTLQDRAVDAVLADEALRRQLIAEHRYLMVDEFQDTDRRQWSLVRALGRPEPDQPADRIFVVGDAKQAIYRFRGGDVTVYRAAIDELRVRPVTFPDNFRSRPELIAWFNHFFARSLGPPSPGRPAYEAPYTPLDARRDVTGGTVTLAVHEAEDAASEGLAEAEAVARLLSAEVLPGRGAWAGLDLLDPEVHREPPVAILLRTRTRLPIYEGALRRMGVPFVVAKGVGFWTRPEVLDLVNLLHALATDDPISTVGALRSPLLGLSDQDLQDLHDRQWGAPTAAGPDGSTGHTLAEFGRYELDDLAPPRVHRAAAALTHLRRVRHRLEVSELLREILRHTSAAHALALQDPSGQAWANAERLVERASRFDGRGPLGLLEAAEHFVAQAEAGTADAEAPIPPTRARVVLMTVHASKGLEFPVVIVPGCGRRPRGRTPSVTHGRIRGDWHIACRALDPTAEVRTRVNTGLHGLLKLEGRAEEAAESKRLLYVAATRARDHLVLVGSHPKGDPDEARQPSWSELLASVHGVEDAEGQRLLTPTGEGRGLEPGERDGLRIVELSDWLGLEPTLSLTTAPAPRPDADAARRLAPIDARLMLEVSPSSLDLFAASPARWYRRNRLGVPDDDTPARAQTRLELAAARGEVIHGLLEDDVVDDEAIAIARWRARAHAEGATPDLVEDGIPELLAHLRRTAADPRVQHRLLADGMDEVRFRMPLHAPGDAPADHELVLTGQIDRLYQADDGTWVVLDWKSGRVDGSVLDAARHHARQLLAYAWAADRILRAHGQPGVSRAEVYFTDVAELVSLGPIGPDHHAAVEADLAEVSRYASLSWEDVVAGTAIAPSALDAVDIGMVVEARGEGLEALGVERHAPGDARDDDADGADSAHAPAWEDDAPAWDDDAPAWDDEPVWTASDAADNRPDAPPPADEEVFVPEPLDDDWDFDHYDIDEEPETRESRESRESRETRRTREAPETRSSEFRASSFESPLDEPVMAGSEAEVGAEGASTPGSDQASPPSLDDAGPRAHEPTTTRERDDAEPVDNAALVENADNADLADPVDDAAFVENADLADNADNADLVQNADNADLALDRDLAPDRDLAVEPETEIEPEPE